MTDAAIQADALTLPERSFQIWEYMPTHRQLLLVSASYEYGGINTRIEIHFGNIRAMFLEPLFLGLHLRRANEEERARLAAKFDLDPEDRGVFLLRPDSDQFIVSSSPAWREGERGYGQPSFFESLEPGPVQMGTIR